MTDLIELDSRLRHLANDLNHALIEHLAATGKLRTPAWRTAFEAVPRHLFVPRFTLPQNDQTHDATAATDSAQREEWLRAVYHDEALLTEVEYGAAIAVVNGLLGLHSGSVKIDNEAHGGCTFTIFLPVHQE